MSIVYTGKHLTKEDNTKALHYFREQTGVASGMVITDRGGAWPEGATCPRTEGEIANERYLKIVNDGAVALGLDKPREFIDGDGDKAVNNYGVDFATGEILFWKEG